MKASALKRKFDAINKAIATQIDKIYDLAEEFEGEEIEQMLVDYADKLSELAITDEGTDSSAVTIDEYIENELIPSENDFHSDDEE